MRVIVAGSRTVTDYNLVAGVLDNIDLPVTCVIEGGARGVDTLARSWAVRNGITFEEYPADWQKYGRRAGPIRNQEMLEVAEALVAIWDGESRGTADMIRRAIDRYGDNRVRIFVTRKR